MRDDTGTYLQFGFGSSDEDTTGIVEPSKIALKLHGRSVISDTSFDPTKLLSTNKLGISPYNTILTITYTVNTSTGTAAKANSIINPDSVEMPFNNRSELSPPAVQNVIASFECTNDNPIDSVNTDITNEELKDRAKAHYATQNIAVT